MGIKPSSASASLLSLFALLFFLNWHFHIRFFPSLLLPILWFVAPIEAWTRPRKGLSKEKCTISNVCLLGPANDPSRKETPPHLPRPPDKVSKEVVLLVHYLTVTVHEHFQRFVFKGTWNSSTIFPLTPTLSEQPVSLAVNRGKGRWIKMHANLLLSLLWLEEIGDILLKWNAVLFVEFTITPIFHHQNIY